MAKRKHLFTYIALAVLISLAVWGAFCDFEIASAVYLGETFSENPFGIIFAFIGVVPTFVGWAFLGASILPFVKTQEMRTGKKRALVTLSVLLFVLSFFYFCTTLYVSNANAFKVHFAVAYPAGSLILLAAAHCGYKLSQKSEDADLLEKVLFLVAFYRPISPQIDSLRSLARSSGQSVCAKTYIIFVTAASVVISLPLMTPIFCNATPVS
jgi:hypothetical protein